MASTRLASIHFATLTGLRNYRATPYEIPAVPMGAQPEILMCDDLMQRDEGPVSTGPGDGRRQQLANEVLGEEIARCLMIEWTEFGRGMSPESHPGVWIVRDRIPVTSTDREGNIVPQKDFRNRQIFRPATDAEFQEMWAEDIANARRADRMYAEWCYGDGNAMAAKSASLIPLIPKNYRLAARQYGLDADWVKSGGALEVRPCQHCGTIVSKTAMICRQCTQPIDLTAWAAWTAQKDAALREAKSNSKAA